MIEEPKTRIIFVDDEEMVLGLLGTALKSQSGEWEMSFVESGETALGLMGEQSPDVVVSDMRMPEMTGAKLLNEVKKRHPATIRIILSGFADEELVQECIGSVHQYLRKPFQVPELRATLRRVFSLKRRVNNKEIRKLVTQMDCLPSIPVVYLEILETLRRPGCSLGEVAEIVAREPGLTTKLLQLVNSAFFGFASQVSSVEEACALLGVTAIQSLALSLRVFSSFNSKKFEPGFIERVWSHSLKVAALAKRIAAAEKAGRTISEQAFTAGLLHDIGKLILAEGLGEAYRAVTRQAAGQERTLVELEEEAFRTNHADLGGYLLDLWGLPLPLVEALAFHHDPAKAPNQEFSPLTAVHAANALEHEANPGKGQAAVRSLDLEYFSSLGLEDRIESWHDLAAANNVKR